MFQANKNKLAAQLIKAEMLGDQEKVTKLKAELENLTSSDTKHVDETSSARTSTSRLQRKGPGVTKREHKGKDSKLSKYLSTHDSLTKMFVEEKNMSMADEAKLYAKTAAKFSKDDMETKFFSEEIDDSQKILNRSNKFTKETSKTRLDFRSEKIVDEDFCDRCADRLAKHLIVDKTKSSVYMCLIGFKPFLSSMSNVVIRNNDHSCDSFVSASSEHQVETENLIESLCNIWKPKGYRCIIMETFYRNRKANSPKELSSCDKHFQIHCLPIKDKHYEKARMYFKQALQDCGGDWSSNKRLIQADGRRIQRYLPVGLSYFWVCFDDLKNGFGHVIESEQEFSRNFGFEVLAGMLDKDVMKLNSPENFKEQFERCRDFKLMYAGGSSSN